MLTSIYQDGRWILQASGHLAKLNGRPLEVRAARPIDTDSNWIGYAVFTDPKTLETRERFIGQSAKRGRKAAMAEIARGLT